LALSRRHGVAQRRDAVPRGEWQQLAASPVLTRELLTLTAVVVLGAIMTVLDATIVNVALPTLGRQFGTSIATIQWVTTAYLLRPHERRRDRLARLVAGLWVRGRSPPARRVGRPGRARGAARLT